MSAPASTRAAEPVQPDGPREIESAALFAGRREVQILHHGERYRLILTRQDKLILNK